jgi:prophage regulatory protein
MRSLQADLVDAAPAGSACNKGTPPLLLRLPQLMQATGLSRTAVYELMKEGRFPKPVRLGLRGTAIAWRYSDVVAWVESLETDGANREATR